MKRFSPVFLAWIGSAILHVLVFIVGSMIVDSSEKIVPDTTVDRVPIYQLEHTSDWTVEIEPAAPAAMVEIQANAQPVPAPVMSPTMAREIMQSERVIRIPTVDTVDLNQTNHAEPPNQPMAPPSTVVQQTSIKESPAVEQQTAFSKSLPTSSAVHGEIPSGRSVVYVLDRSASMGLLRESFSAGRASIYQSILSLPVQARFNVVCYGTTADWLLPDSRANWLTQDIELLRSIRFHLEKLTPEGRSQHDAGIRKALVLEPDYLILVTDAETDEFEVLKPILRSTRKPVKLYVARVASGKILPLQEIR